MPAVLSVAPLTALFAAKATSTPVTPEAPVADAFGAMLQSIRGSAAVLKAVSGMTPNEAAPAVQSSTGAERATPAPSAGPGAAPGPSMFTTAIGFVASPDGKATATALSGASGAQELSQTVPTGTRGALGIAPPVPVPVATTRSGATTAVPTAVPSLPVQAVEITLAGQARAPEPLAAPIPAAEPAVPISSGLIQADPAQTVPQVKRAAAAPAAAVVPVVSSVPGHDAVPARVAPRAAAPRSVTEATPDQPIKTATLIQGVAPTLPATTDHPAGSTPSPKTEAPVQATPLPGLGTSGQIAPSRNPRAAQVGKAAEAPISTPLATPVPPVASMPAAGNPPAAPPTQRAPDPPAAPPVQRAAVPSTTPPVQRAAVPSTTPPVQRDVVPPVAPPVQPVASIPPAAVSPVAPLADPAVSTQAATPPRPARAPLGASPPQVANPQVAAPAQAVIPSLARQPLEDPKTSADFQAVTPTRPAAAATPSVAQQAATPSSVATPAQTAPTVQSAPPPSIATDNTPQAASPIAIALKAAPAVPAAPAAIGKPGPDKSAPVARTTPSVPDQPVEAMPPVAPGLAGQGRTQRVLPAAPPPVATISSPGPISASANPGTVAPAPTAPADPPAPIATADPRQPAIALSQTPDQPPSADAAIPVVPITTAAPDRRIAFRQAAAPVDDPPQSVADSSTPVEQQGIPAPTLSPAPPGPSPVTAAHQAQPSAPVQQVAPALLTLARTTDGSHQMTIRLQPAELGMVQIQIERAPSGTTQIIVTAEKADTLQALQRDQPQLHRALDEAGIPGAGRTMSFHVAGSADTTPASTGSGRVAADSANPDGSAGADTGGSRESYQSRGSNAYSTSRRSTGTAETATLNAAAAAKTYRGGLDITA